ncbi:hemin-degrading factor [Rhodobacteraceae bacterium]|nr:hemin-degrading factor [Paracoccaceae bacterium]
MTDLTQEALRTARAGSPDLRARDLARRLGVSEGALVHAHIDHGAQAITPHPDAIIPALRALGPVMALTRNDSCVIEKTGIYDHYRPGPHAGLVVNDTIDLRIFPKHWVHGFALDEGAGRRSIQIFDASGTAVHKVWLGAGSDHGAWGAVIEALRLPLQQAPVAFEPPAPPEPARANPARRAELLAGWDALTDTHQFLRLTARLKMNRLGAYRLAGAPYVRRLAGGAVQTLLARAALLQVPVMVFVGNRGMIEIHTGPVHRVLERGPWLNVLDPGFDLHLRMDHVAEAYHVQKMTQRGMAHSVEVFDDRGALIAQIFGVLRASPEAVEGWNTLVAELPDLPAHQPEGV